MWKYNQTNELYHHGIKGQKWGVRRYQNEDGSLTAQGMSRYGVSNRQDRSYTSDYNRRLHAMDSANGRNIRGVGKNIRYLNNAIAHPLTTSARYAIANKAGLSETQEAAKRNLRSKSVGSAALNSMRLQGAMARDRARIYNKREEDGAVKQLARQTVASVGLSLASKGMRIATVSAATGYGINSPEAGAAVMVGGNIVANILGTASSVMGTQAAVTAYGMATSAYKDRNKK